MLVNADRQGPKDMVQMALREHAFRKAAATKVELDLAKQAGDPATIAAAEDRNQGAFQELLDAHGGDHTLIPQTAKFIQDRIDRGKASA